MGRTLWQPEQRTQEHATAEAMNSSAACAARQIRFVHEMTPSGGAKTHPAGAPSGWKYVNVRRLFVYVEHFIEEGANWAVFERKPSAPGNNFGAAP